MSCRHAETCVLNSRATTIGGSPAIRRRRQCLGCAAKFSTLEVFIPFNRRRGRKAVYSAEEVARWRALSEAGMTDAQIAAATGASPATVWRKLYPL